MSLSLDDLGRAAVDKVHEHEPEPDVTWDQIDDADRSIIRVAVLAAVERFAEEADKLIDRVARACIMASLSHGNSEVRIAMDKTANMIQDELKTLLASLRAEAGQKSNAAQLQKGSE